MLVRKRRPRPVDIGLAREEGRELKALTTPQRIQQFVIGLGANFEEDGDTLRSVRGVLVHRKAHCIEAAFVAACALWLNGDPPFLMDLTARKDSDHVIAVSTIVSRQRNAWTAAIIGSLWGVGHTVTITVVGGAIILFGVVIPPRLGLAMEFSVALMLILLGVLSLTGVTQRVTGMLTNGNGSPGRMHAHPHSHSDYVHTHPHGHEPESHGHVDTATPLWRIDRLFGSLGVYQLVRPLVVGIVHGLAGSAAVALLVLAAVNMLSFELTLGRSVHRWDKATAAPPAGRVVAVLSLVIWISVIFAGRLIGFTTSRAKEVAPTPADVNLEELFQAAPAAPPQKK